MIINTGRKIEVTCHSHPATAPLAIAHALVAAAKSGSTAAGGKRPVPKPFERGKRLALDPMASMLGGGRTALVCWNLRREAIRSWASTLDAWAASEEKLSGHDTERLERLVQQAWNACVLSLRTWDSRFALQAVRSIPPSVVRTAAQLYGDTGSVAMIVRLMTAAAVAGDVKWPRVKEGTATGLGLTGDQLTDVTALLPEVLGRSIGTATLTWFAQGWYRWAGKGEKVIAIQAALILTT